MKYRKIHNSYENFIKISYTTILFKIENDYELDRA